MPFLSHLKNIVLFLVIVVDIGILGYHVIEGYGWLDALYMTVITLTTVGFHEVHPLSPRGQIFTIVLLMSGLGVVFYTLVAVVERVVEGEFQQFFGRRRMQKSIEALSAHYIVCGFGRIGEVICRELSSKPTPFVTIDNEEGRLHRAETAQYLVYQGDATEEKTLTAVGVTKARGLFATLSNDAANVFLTLTAKGLNPSLFVVARAESERSEPTLKRSGADVVISPYAMGGHRMAQAALRPAVVDIIDLATHYQSLELQMEEFPIPAGSWCCEQRLYDAEFHARPGIIVVAIKQSSGRMVFNPDPNEILHAGDSLIVLAEAKNLKMIEQHLFQGL